MASISYDGQCLMVDGRRLWLVCGSIDYCRIPRGLWRDRIRAAAQAGLNCLVVSVYWHIHETQPGVFRFEDEFDLRDFVEMIGDEGMHCILRPGPFVGGAADMGGLPPWLLESGSMKLRQGDTSFLQAVARWFDAVIAKIKTLQVTHSRPGPIVLVQVENEWLCHNPAEGENYLHELTRFLREAGVEVPLIAANKLWQSIPGVIDGWNGSANLLANSRQLRLLQPGAPRLITCLPVGSPGVWGQSAPTIDAAQLLRSVAEASAAGAMVNLEPFVGGTHFSFRAGRSAGGPEHFHTTSYDAGAPVGEGGIRRDSYRLLRRLCTFLSRFHGVMSHLDPAVHPAVAAPGAPLSVVHLSGSQGQVLLLFRNPDSPQKQFELLTGAGQSLNIDFGDDTVAWMVLDSRIDGVGRIDFSTLRPWAVVGRKLLIFFGPAGSRGSVSLDGTHHSITVPDGDQPLILRHDHIHLVVLNHRQLDAAYLHRHGIYVGCSALDGDDQPIRHPDHATCYAIDENGAVKNMKLAAPPVAAAPKIGKWDAASLEAYAAGTAPRYATLSGPQGLEASGADFGYGWYRLRLKRSRPGKKNLLPAAGGDRLHFYQGGKLRTILGLGPGAVASPIEWELPAGPSEWVIFADNWGRFADGALINLPKGLAGHLLEVEPVKLGKAAVEIEPRVDPFTLSGYVPHCSVDERPLLPRHTLTVNLIAKMPLVLHLSGDRPRSVILLNGQPAALDAETGVARQIVLLDGAKKGANRLTIAQIDGLPEGQRYELAEHLKIYKAAEIVTEQAEWWYARWQLPGPTAFKPMNGSGNGAPTFFRSTFTLAAVDRPLWLTITRATKGQLYVNGRNLGRYFIAAPNGKSFGPTQTRHYLPEPWLRADEENEIILFDEHGVMPEVKLGY